jgi:hypothetical protein
MRASLNKPTKTCRRDENEKIHIIDVMHVCAWVVVVFGLVLNRFNVSMLSMAQKNREICYPYTGVH